MQFTTALSHVNRMMYEPLRLPIYCVQEEMQNVKYGAGTFQLATKTIRFRVANVTPTKIGQFVAFWQKDEQNRNQPYSYEETPDFVVITTFKDDQQFGQFVFPKELLLEQNILASPSTKGKMSLRVYPAWDQPTSKQAMNSQNWQLPYFVDMSIADPLQSRQVLALYGFV